MIIQTENLGKRFNRDWIFRKVDLSIDSGTKLAITGPNGSGKSTLLKILGTYNLATEGTITFIENNITLDQDEIQTRINFAAPYYNLIEEFTLREQLAFHSKFKNPIHNLDEVVTQAQLAKALDKPIKDYSSGMKQRVKLILAFYFDARIILLDEPTSNLDQDGIDWFKELVRNSSKNAIVIMASNLKHEIEMCSKTLLLKDFQS